MWGRGSGRGNAACGGGAVGGVTQHVGEGQWAGQHSMCHLQTIAYSLLYSEPSLYDLCRW